MRSESVRGGDSSRRTLEKEEGGVNESRNSVGRVSESRNGEGRGVESKAPCPVIMTGLCGGAEEKKSARLVSWPALLETVMVRVSGAHQPDREKEMKAGMVLR